MLIFDKNLVTS